MNRGSSLIDYSAARLRMLCTAAGFGPDTEGVLRIFRGLVSPWADTPAGADTGWVSEISDDNTPVEFSVAITDEEVDVRVLFEAQAAAPTLRAYRQAGLALHERLERELGADLRRFRLLQDLFLPEELRGPFAVWSSAVFTKGRRASFKAYFNPQARGAAAAGALVEEALRRLGLRRAWGALCRAAVRRGPREDELKYFALDLTPDAESRVKVYVRHHAATPNDLEIACAAAEGYLPGEARAFARAMRGGDDPLAARAAATCSAFVDGGGDRPTATTLYIPVCAYSRDDRVVYQRVTDYLRASGLSPRRYQGIIEGFADRPLAAGVGMQSWVALRRQRGRARLSVYLGTEARQVAAPGSVPAPTRDALRGRARRGARLE